MVLRPLGQRLPRDLLALSLNISISCGFFVPADVSSAHKNSYKLTWPKNKVIGTRGQGVQVLCPRELTTEHLTEPSLRLD